MDDRKIGIICSTISVLLLVFSECHSYCVLNALLWPYMNFVVIPTIFYVLRVKVCQYLYDMSFTMASQEDDDLLLIIKGKIFMNAYTILMGGKSYVIRIIIILVTFIYLKPIIMCVITYNILYAYMEYIFNFDYVYSKSLFFLKDNKIIVCSGELFFNGNKKMTFDKVEWVGTEVRGLKVKHYHLTKMMERLYSVDRYGLGDYDIGVTSNLNNVYFENINIRKSSLFKIGAKNPGFYPVEEREIIKYSNKVIYQPIEENLYMLCAKTLSDAMIDNKISEMVENGIISEEYAYKWVKNNEILKRMDHGKYTRIENIIKSYKHKSELMEEVSSKSIEQSLYNNRYDITPEKNIQKLIKAIKEDKVLFEKIAKTIKTHNDF